MLNYAVWGEPISHSLSPRIHAQFAEQSGVALQYRAERCPASELVEKLAHSDCVGLNLTQPLKQIALAHCATLSPLATRAKAVNTLVRVDDRWHGHNTDGIGLIRDLTNRHGVTLPEKRLLILGAGGAAAGVIPTLLDAGVGSILIANRNIERAEQLVLQQQSTKTSVRACRIAALVDEAAFDLIIHASSAGLNGDAISLPSNIANNSSIGYDLSYGAAATPFLRWASEQEFTAYDGLGMLVEQAAEAFLIWHGMRPTTQKIWGELRAAV
jgi:shikimate dehydrogenase